MKLFAKIGAFTEARRLEALNLYPFFKPITGGDGTTLVIEGRPRLNMGSNNYLGLTHHPRIIEAGRRAAQKYGTGCTGSRFLNGTLDLHLELEQALAKLTGKQAALVYPTGYQANVGLVSGLVTRGETVIIDKADHASIIDGARLSFRDRPAFRPPRLRPPRAAAAPERHVRDACGLPIRDRSRVHWLKHSLRSGSDDERAKRGKDPDHAIRAADLRHCLHGEHRFFARASLGTSASSSEVSCCPVDAAGTSGRRPDDPDRSAGRGPAMNASRSSITTYRVCARP